MADDTIYESFKDRLRDSGAGILLLTGTDPDMKQAMELGTMILLGLPLIVAADGGTPVPPDLHHIARAVVSVDVKNYPERAAETIRDVFSALTGAEIDEVVAPDEIGDEHHNMEELYEYRMLYNAWTVRAWIAQGYKVTKSYRHHDGELCLGGGWFIVQAELPTGQVSNHYHAWDWELFRCPSQVRADEWDGHTPAVAAQRIRDALKETR